MPNVRCLLLILLSDTRRLMSDVWFLLCFTLYSRVNSKYKPPGGLHSEGWFNGGFLRYDFAGLIFGGAYTWRGLFSEFYGMCFLGRGAHITRDICFLGRGAHITRDMCFLHRGTLSSRDMSFPVKGTHIARDMWFLGWGTQIVRDMCFLGRGTHIPRVMCSASLKVTVVLLSWFYITHAWRFLVSFYLDLTAKNAI